MLRFDPGVANPIGRFGSAGVAMARIARPSGDVRVGCMHLEPGGVIGFHPATVPQLLLVVAGHGTVRGAEPDPTPIAAGQAAFWEAGEWHETRAATEAALTAVVLEAERIDLLAPDAGEQGKGGH